MKIISLVLGLLFLAAFTGNSYAENQTISSFSKAKKLLLSNVYFDNRETLYCGANFDMNKYVEHPLGFTSKTHKKRSKKVEWQHAVPVENFGRTFSEWRDGHEKCVSNKGKAFKGRRCAEKNKYGI